MKKLMTEEKEMTNNRYSVYCKYGEQVDWYEDYKSFPEAEIAAEELVEGGYDEAWVVPLKTN